MKHPVTPHEIHVSRMVAFHQAAFDQYKERTGQTYRQVINSLQEVHRTKGDDAVKALVDAVVDPHLQSAVWEHERQVFLATHYPDKYEMPKEQSTQLKMF